jgi:N-acetylmuramoyl-L-alanine amidase
MTFLPDTEYQRRKNTNFLVVHCSATKPSQDIGVKEIREWHIKERKWTDIGYHYVIRRDGARELGRPTWAIGAHVEGANWQSLGICLVGGVDEAGQPANNFTPEQMTTLEQALTVLYQQYYGRAKVVGHHDFDGVKKACPSFDAKGWWASIGAALDKAAGRGRE